MKSSIPIALQLYSVRDELADDFEGVIRKVAEFGYTGVEPVDFVIPSGISFTDAGKLFKELNLHVPSVYMSSKTDKDSMLKTAALFNSKRIILSPDLFDTVDDIKRATRAGMGLCQSKTCFTNVQKIICEELNIKKDDIRPMKIRIPIRPMKAEILSEDN